MAYRINELNFLWKSDLRYHEAVDMGRYSVACIGKERGISVAMHDH